MDALEALKLNLPSLSSEDIERLLTLTEGVQSAILSERLRRVGEALARKH